uniref:Uncharacterized protein n=1 Tax=Arundo donax TaxID=35708 RepID=A0A0A8Z2P4_ARUDO
MHMVHHLLLYRLFQCNILHNKTFN